MLLIMIGIFFLVIKKDFYFVVNFLLFTAADEMNKKKLHGDSSTSEHNNSNMVISICIACDFCCIYFVFTFFVCLKLTVSLVLCMRYEETHVFLLWFWTCCMLCLGFFKGWWKFTI